MEKEKKEGKSAKFHFTFKNYFLQLLFNVRKIIYVVDFCWIRLSIILVVCVKRKL